LFEHILVYTYAFSLDSNASTAAKKADAHHQHAQYVGKTDAQVDNSRITN